MAYLQGVEGQQPGQQSPDKDGNGYTWEVTCPDDDRQGPAEERQGSEQGSAESSGGSACGEERNVDPAEGRGGATRRQGLHLRQCRGGQQRAGSRLPPSRDSRNWATVLIVNTPMT